MKISENNNPTAIFVRPLINYFLLVSWKLKIVYHINRLAAGMSFYSDFRYESNGIFVLGVGFFSSDKFRL